MRFRTVLAIGSMGLAALGVLWGAIFGFVAHLATPDPSQALSFKQRTGLTGTMIWLPGPPTRATGVDEFIWRAFP